MNLNTYLPSKDKNDIEPDFESADLTSPIAKYEEEYLHPEVNMDNVRINDSKIIEITFLISHSAVLFLCLNTIISMIAVMIQPDAYASKSPYANDVPIKVLII